MNLYELYTKLYGYTRNYPCIHRNILTPLRCLLRYLASKQLPVYFSKHPAELSSCRREDVIISLTSFPARIEYVYMTIESLLRQSVLPRYIYLWLSMEQFPTLETIPTRLRDLQNGIFRIRLVNDDIRSHKKYFYALIKYPDSTIITVDDDIIYPSNIIKTLLDYAELYPTCIVANVARTISYNNNQPEVYSRWHLSKPLSSKNNVQIGAGGVLYPPHSLYKDCLNLELSQKLSPTVDDLWLNAMARLNGTDVIKTPYKQKLLPIVIPKNEKLTTVNVQGNRNNEQLDRIRKYYSKTEIGDPYLVK